jgi:hypothetical protein
MLDGWGATQSATQNTHVDPLALISTDGCMQTPFALDTILCFIMFHLKSKFKSECCLARKIWKGSSWQRITGFRNTSSCIINLIYEFYSNFLCAIFSTHI